MSAVRPAADADAEAFIAIVSACWDEYPGCVSDIDGEAPELRALASAMGAKSGAAWAAEADGEVIGLCASWPHEGRTWEVGKMYVAARHRGQGAARALLDTAEAHARAAGAAEMRLFSDTRFDRAHAFYEKAGYVRAGGLRALGDKSNSIEFAYAKPLTGVVVRALDVAALGSAEGRLAVILKTCVDSGAAVSFLAPLPLPEARAVWHRAGPAVARGVRVVLAAWVEGVLAGTVTLDCDTPQNQPHRAEITKLLVHPEARRRGVARADDPSRARGRPPRPHPAHARHPRRSRRGRAIRLAGLDSRRHHPGLRRRRGWRLARYAVVLQARSDRGIRLMNGTSYDPEADAYYARFVPDGTPIAETIEAADGVMIDLDASGQVIGIEVLSVRLRAAGMYGPAKEAAA